MKLAASRRPGFCSLALLGWHVAYQEEPAQDQEEPARQEPVQEDTPGELEENGEKVEKIWLLREE